MPCDTMLLQQIELKRCTLQCQCIHRLGRLLHRHLMYSNRRKTKWRWQRQRQVGQIQWTDPCGFCESLSQLGGQVHLVSQNVHFCVWFSSCFWCWSRQHRPTKSRRQLLPEHKIPTHRERDKASQDVADYHQIPQRSCLKRESKIKSYSESFSYVNSGFQ